MFFYAVIVGLIYAVFSDNLPDIDTLETFQPKRVTRVWSADGSHLLDFKEENRELIRDFDEIPQAMKDALISIEDRRFFSHWGIDLRRVFGAIKANLLSLDPTAEGASTLTQQLARNLYDIGNERRSATFEQLKASFARKIREAITAINIERLYTKQEILTTYLNTVFFGHSSYGLKSAARFYFDKDASGLTIEESATLAGLLPSPNGYSPKKNPTKSKQRRNTVLRLMKQAGMLTSREYRELSAKPIVVRQAQPGETVGLAPYFVEDVRIKLEAKYGSSLYTDGLRIHTTIDSRLQLIAERAYETQIPKVQLAVNKHLAAQDSSAGLPDSAIVQAAFVAMDPSTGHILAMIGGRDFNTSRWNRATQAERQAGSAFKAFVYTAALDNGMFPSDSFEDNAFTFTERDGSIWTPENYDRKFLGMMTLRDGFKQSRNLIAIKLTDLIGPSNIRQRARDMGITTPMGAFLALGIGASEVKLIDLVSAYGVFPNQGIRVDPVAVTSIRDGSDNLIEESTHSPRVVLRPAVAVLMTDMMRSVVNEPGGTGYRTLRRHRFSKPQAAGKTGTTNNYADAWFIGFTPHLVAGVWVGIDDPGVSLAGKGGASAALPLWAEFMKGVYDEVDYYRDRADAKFDYPESMISRLPVCADTHKLARRYCPNRTEDLFVTGDVLPQFCPLHGGDSGERQEKF